VQQFAVKIPINSDNFPIINFPVLEAYNDYTNYTWLPAVFFGTRLRVVLRKALYGEKQAGNLWNDLCNNILINMGFERCGVAL
jgi:hypothetical protein